MTEIKMPSAGQTTDEASIVSVNVKPGDTVKRGEVLWEAESPELPPVQPASKPHTRAAQSTRERIRVCFIRKDLLVGS